jgi:hypothetical protein
VTNVIGIIEGCDPRDRGYLLTRLTQIYFGASGAKQVRGALKSSKTAKKGKKSKTSWKKEWEATEAFKAWQDHITAGKGMSPDERAATETEYVRLRTEAFRVRDTIKSAANDNKGGANTQG